MHGLEAHFQRMEEMRRERIVSWSESLQRWCVCNGLATILATAATRAEAEALKNKPFHPEQLPLL